MKKIRKGYSWLAEDYRIYSPARHLFSLLGRYHKVMINGKVIVYISFGYSEYGTEVVVPRYYNHG